MSHDHHCKFAELVNLYAYDPDYLSATITVAESFDDFLRLHQNWLNGPTLVE